jgi:long-chain acyl-CoA synthetase
VVPAGTFLPGGWVTCHDVGYQDADGFFYVIDRSRDLIKTGGETVSSVEVEDVLTRHPRVREAAVVGRLDADWGERVHAVVSPYATDPAPDDALSREVLHWCRQFLSPYKVPKTIEWIPDLPKSPVGKILKRALADHSSVAP